MSSILSNSNFVKLLPKIVPDVVNLVLFFHLWIKTPKMINTLPRLRRGQRLFLVLDSLPHPPDEGLRLTVSRPPIPPGPTPHELTDQIFPPVQSAVHLTADRV